MADTLASPETAQALHLPSRAVSSTRRKSWPKKLVVTVAVAVAAVILNMPLIGALLTSVKPAADIAQGALSFPFLPTLTHFVDVLSASELPMALINSVLISLGSVVLTLLLTYPAAFAIARLSFGGSRFLQFVSSLRLMPAIFFVIPLYLLFGELGMLDTIYGMIIVNTFVQLTLALLILVAAFRDLPREIEEAAALDGCGILRVLTVISAPMLAPSIVAASLLTFLFTWSEYLFATVLTTSDATPVTVAAAKYAGSFELAWGEVSAVAVLSVLPPIILCVLLQKYLVSGLTAGAIKG
ncbi:carbohydrate ABC transporter permease [Paramicrobacterium chengjingii]|uniref:Carbohydrate ABC transporter permease n=1 Tax=Paramicrobacterium chengjingii TaxID=2769067 RepID=A0ABX6YI02_9MICO|nr:carbohydrate ABC transporter permease [Microbacterium chengjingii]QPZ38245.1 carbohydrate ABC transporter permease [Microbacterium chengjingii]